METRVVLLSDQLKQVRTLRVLCTSTLSVASAITLCVRSGCLSHYRPCARVSTPSLHELPFHGGFYPVSTPITAIRHRCSSFCTWPTYLPLSPESFSRCRLRWTTPPSPHTPTARLRPGSPPACSPPPPPFLERKSATVIYVPGLWITLNLKGCNARYQRVIRALVSFMRWSHCKGAWSEQRVNSRPRR